MKFLQLHTIIDNRMTHWHYMLSHFSCVTILCLAYIVCLKNDLVYISVVVKQTNLFDRLFVFVLLSFCLRFGVPYVLEWTRAPLFGLTFVSANRFGWTQDAMWCHACVTKFYVLDFFLPMLKIIKNRQLIYSVEIHTCADRWPNNIHVWRAFV